MKNLNAYEKSRGIVAFALNTSTTDYESIANLTVKLAAQTLDMPYTLITQDYMADKNWHNYRNDRDLDCTVEWKNFGRNLAYDLSPYNETLVIDVDYVVLDDSILKIFDTDWDYLLTRSARSLNNEAVPMTMGSYSLPFVWATVFAFRKTSRAKMFFDLVRRIEANYHYYRELFLVESRSYRNDYAFAMADVIVNGFRLDDCAIPGNLLNVLHAIQSLEIKDNKLIVRDQDLAYVLPRTNLHVMSKQYLQSENFKEFINSVSS